jgi:hypothetical protein
MMVPQQQQQYIPETNLCCQPVNRAMSDANETKKVSSLICVVTALVSCAAHSTSVVLSS